VRKINIFTVLIVFIFSLFAQPAAAETYTFKDVDQNNSHFEGISYLTSKGIVNGYNDGTYKPYRTITRSQTAVLFMGARDLPVPKNKKEVLNNFKDIDATHRYSDAIAATYQAGIFKGSNGYFNDGALSREQMATVLVKAYGLKDTGKNVNANLTNVGSSHKNNVKILFQHGITNQKDNFRPRESVTRGQFATFLYKVIKNTKDDETKEDEDNDIVVVHDEVELAYALSSSSSNKIVKLGNSIELTDTIFVRNEGVQIKGYSEGWNYLIIGAPGKTVFEVEASNVHFDEVRVLQENGIAYHVLSREGFKLSDGLVSSTDESFNGSGIIIEDNFAMGVNETARITNNIIEVPDIGVSFDGGILKLEDNLIENTSTGLRFTSIEFPRNIEGNIFFNNYEDIQVEWLSQVEKFLPLNHFDYGGPKINRP